MKRSSGHTHIAEEAEKSGRHGHTERISVVGWEGKRKKGGKEGAIAFLMAVSINSYLPNLQARVSNRQRVQILMLQQLLLYEETRM